MNARKLAVALIGSGAVAALAFQPSHPTLTASASTGPLAFDLRTVGKYGGEPSLVSDGNGALYMATPSGGTVNYVSTDQGKTWHEGGLADSASGDDCLGVDQSNAVYMCNLAGTDTLPLQADVWKTTNKGASWTEGTGFAPTCTASCNPFGVDRDWIDAAILPPATTTAQAEVVLMYHDFYGPSHIWVNISHDGGATFGAPVEVLSSPAVTTGAITGSLEAEGYTFCNTVPAGVGIVRPGHANAGRIYVGWIAADAPTDATGCNITQVQAFHTFWVSWSDDNGATWTTQQAFDAGVGHDASTPFVGFTLDDQGNPYFGFTVQGPNDNVAVCAAESAAGTVQSDTSCEYHMYVIWSKDGGATWDGGGGLIAGSAATAYQVDPPSETGTHFFPAIAVHDPGQVDVAYLYTPTIVPTDALGKADPGGCAGPDPANGNPPTYPPACTWYLHFGQSVSLPADPSTATFTTTRATAKPMHVGDICNLGIFCTPFPDANRNLLDFIQVAIDPTTGCAHIAYPDDNTVQKLRVANQTGGCFAVAAGVPTPATTAAVAGTTTTPPATQPTATSPGIPNTSGASAHLAAPAGAAALLLLTLPAIGRRLSRPRRRRTRD